MLIHSAYGLPVEALDVVIIEDNESMIRILRAILTAFGISKIRSHTNCEAALADMFDRPPDLVISDWRMEPMNGLQFLRNLRHQTMGALATTAVVMVSGYASAARVKQAMLAGANQFLVKPVSPAALLARLEWVVRDDRQFLLKGNRYVIEGVETLFSAKGQHMSQSVSAMPTSPEHTSALVPGGAGLAATAGDGQAGGQAATIWEL